MKKTLLIFIFANALSFSQGNIYPTETNYGGGIGFSSMYMVLDSIPGQSILNSLCFDTDELGTKPLVFFGGEGFAQMSGPWRLGGYAGIGTQPVSNVYDIKTYEEKNDIAGYQKDNIDETSSLKQLTDRLTINARINFLMGAMTVEYVIPIYRDLEVTTGALMGVGGYSLAIDQHVKVRSYADIGKQSRLEDGISKNLHHAYYDREDKTVYVDINKNDKSYDDFIKFFEDHTLPDPNETKAKYREMNLAGSMTEMSGTFFNFQPYVAVKWQFLDRMGLRISAGFNKGLIGEGKMKLNGHMPIGDSSKSSLHGFTVRTVLYFGL